MVINKTEKYLVHELWFFKHGIVVYVTVKIGLLATLGPGGA